MAEDMQLFPILSFPVPCREKELLKLIRLSLSRVNLAEQGGDSKDIYVNLKQKQLRSLLGSNLMMTIYLALVE